MPKQTFCWVAVFVIPCSFVITYIGLIHYFLPVRGTPNEFHAWSIFLLFWYIYWFLWVPFLAYILWRLLTSAGIVRLHKDA